MRTGGIPWPGMQHNGIPTYLHTHTVRILSHTPGERWGTTYRGREPRGVAGGGSWATPKATSPSLISAYLLNLIYQKSKIEKYAQQRITQ